MIGRPRLGKAVEALAALALALPAIFFAAKYVRAMATTSLWTDEIWSIQHYSSLGPRHVLTTYEEANNHVLFNLASSLLPGRDSVLPLRARSVSFAAVAGLLVGVGALFLASGRPVAAALAVYLFAGNPEFLDLTLQARGYGLAAVGALLVAAGATRFLETGSRAALASCAVGAVLGTWAVPTFSLLAAPFFVLLLFARPGREVLAAGAGALVVTLLVHAGVIAGMLHEMAGYAGRSGRQFGEISAVLESVKLFSLRALPWQGDVLAVGLLLGLPLVLVLLPRRAREATAAPRVLSLSVVLFYAACLVLKTPIVRSTSFAAVPLLLACLLAGGAAARALPQVPRAGAAAILALVLVPPKVRDVRSFDFVPLENWSGTANLLATALPEGYPVFVDFDSRTMARYAAPETRLAREFDAEAFRRGEMALVDSVVAEPPERLDPRAFFSTLGDLRLRQRRARYMALFVPPPVACGIRGATSAGSVDVTGLLCDRDGATFVPGGSGARGDVRLELTAPGPVRSMFLLWGEDRPVSPVSALAAAHGSETWTPPLKHWGRTTLVLLGDREVERVTVSPTGTPDRPPLLEVWVFPVSGRPAGGVSSSGNDSPARRGSSAPPRR